jgi:hypothetical protein
MLFFICRPCEEGDHDHCFGERKPPPGHFGGAKCVCEGDCANNKAEPSPQVQAVFDALDAQAEDR